jgi:hypothetical protein
VLKSEHIQDLQLRACHISSLQSLWLLRKMHQKWHCEDWFYSFPVRDKRTHEYNIVCSMWNKVGWLHQYHLKIDLYRSYMGKYKYKYFLPHFIFTMREWRVELLRIACKAEF